MLKLNKISLSDDGNRINYDYSIEKSADKYFNKENIFYAKYDVDLNQVPNSILVIPFIANVLPIAWFAGFEVEVPEIDEDFYSALKNIKTEFKKQFSNYQLNGGLKVKSIKKNHIQGNETAMLFSGGVDAYATYIRNYKKNPDLVTILGADIEITDKHQWKSFTSFIENEPLLSNNNKEYIETNVRMFYTYKVELLLKDIGWWGIVQHGLSLIGSLAPLSFVKSYKNIYIASSYTKEIDIAWGSTPFIDEKISWAGIHVFHDGYELKRQDKVDLIAKFANDTKNQFKLRVCYSELRNSFNCSNCEKCFRTILGLILNGEDPNKYGFNVDENVYNNMFKVINQYGASKGMQYFWWELMEKAKSSENIFIFKDIQIENSQLDKLRNGELYTLMENQINTNRNYSERLKFIIRNKYPKLITLYKKIKL